MKSKPVKVWVVWRTFPGVPIHARSVWLARFDAINALGRDKFNGVAGGQYGITSAIVDPPKGGKR
jgi:hypothetical protein